MPESQQTQEELSEILFGNDAGFAPQTEEQYIPEPQDIAPVEETQESQEEVVEEVADAPDLGSEIAFLKGQIETLTANKPVEVSDADAKFIADGKKIAEFQNTNPEAFQKMIQYGSKLANGQNPEQDNAFNSSVTTMRDNLKSEKYKDIDTAPMEQMLDLMEMQNNNNVNVMQQQNNARNANVQEINALKAQHQQREDASRNAQIDSQMAELKQAEKEYGVEIAENSVEANKLIALVGAGIPITEAYLDVTRKTEADKAQPEGKPVKQAAPRKRKSTSTTPQMDALGDQLFGNSLRSADLFK